MFRNNTQKILKWADQVAIMEEGRISLKILSGKPTGKRTLGRPRHRWEDNIKMELKEICFNTRNWVDLAQNRDYLRILINAACTSGFHKSWN